MGITTMTNGCCMLESMLALCVCVRKAHILEQIAGCVPCAWQSTICPKCAQYIHGAPCGMSDDGRMGPEKTLSGLTLTA